MSELLDFHGPNAGYALELYERFRQDPQSVDAETRAYFQNGFSPDALLATTDSHRPVTTAPIAAAPAPDLTKVVSAARLGRIVRELGHLEARIDPLGSDPPSDPSLKLEAHNLSTADLEGLPASVIGGPLSQDAPNALEALARLRRAYSGSIGYEDDHIQVAAEREWLRKAVETGRFLGDISAEEKRAVLRQLVDVDTFEQYLENTPPFKGEKRFSIEGSDVMVPILDTIIRCTAQVGTREVVMGMAHRGRLNVLAHVLGKPYSAILSEFPGMSAPQEAPAVAGSGALGYTGDVKYHKGFLRTYRGDGKGAKEMRVSLAPNPSHLEFVNPAVVGRARAAQDNRDKAGQTEQDIKASLAILIHGDAAFPGQGVVAETLNLGQLKGYTVGGTIHIIANNQVGFTTDWQDARSTLYASDLAKGFEIPIIHVNADDPEACLAAAKMACAYHANFGKDFLIDLVGYRRRGHNETDEPRFTQPMLYQKIDQHPRPHEIYAKKLEEAGIVSRDEYETMLKDVKQRLSDAKNTPAPKDKGYNYPDASEDRGGESAPSTAVPAERLQALHEALVMVPEGFTPSPNFTRGNGFLTTRREALDKENGLLWAHCEALAYASLLEDGTPIRLTGQDSERGTWGQRNLVLHDATSGNTFCALKNLPTAKASLSLYNSPLSETAALGFEYGYSIHASDTLVLWEAQFGDFANGAQVIIDQFIVSGNAKWAQSPSVIMLLPHGYEGQGPEHSSARIERFLQLCAGDNLRVANCTCGAQYFHLLRRHAAQLKSMPRPLVIFTPKSILRHPRAAASRQELETGSFRPIIDDVRDPSRKAGVTRLILCSGKIYFDLAYGGGPKFDLREEFLAAENVAVARVEELNPFPAAELADIVLSYPNLEEVVWVQEEPQNMGAWTFMQPRIGDLLPEGVVLRYVGRAAEASPAEGSILQHRAEQARIVAEAFAAGSEARNAARNGASTNGTGKVPVKSRAKRTEAETHAG